MPAVRQRYLFIDLFRCLAAFFMIQGHVFDALLSPSVKAHPWYYLHDFFHGFVAPAFLFASGVAWGISTLRRWDEHSLWGPRARRRMMRFLGLIAIGYALHLPFFSLRKTINGSSPAELQALAQSDVLQCIGVTLLLLQVAALLLRERQVFERAVAVAAAAVIFCAPWMWSGRLAGYLPLPLVSYLTPETGSWFPLFPWSAYILSGVVLGALVADAEQAAPVIWKNAALNAAMILLAWVVMYLPFDFYPAHDFWKSNPMMFFVRLGAVSLVASAIFLMERRAGKGWGVLTILGRHSLLIYVMHLVMVYGSVVNRGLAQRIGPTLPVLRALAVFAAVFGGIALATVLWHRLKKSHETIASWITFAGAAAFVVAFVLRPW